MSEPQIRFSYLPVDAPITGRFGETMPPWSPVRPHLGVDFGCPTGTPVIAPADGEVVVPANDGSFGIAVCLRHADGWYTLYAHLSRAHVRAGDRVRAGQQLGLSGATGYVTGPHLHWQMCDTWMFPRDASRNRDPLVYHTPGQPGQREDEMTPEERELLLRVASILFGSPAGLEFGSVAEALAEARRLEAVDTRVLLGLARTQQALAEHTHGGDGSARWPGRI